MDERKDKQMMSPDHSSSVEFHAPTECSKVGSECVVDYSNEFITQEIFTSREALINWAREVGRRNGFIVVIKTSAAPNRRNKKPRLTLGCERSGSYRDIRITKDGTGGKKLKHTGSKKCGCPFTLRGKVVGSNEEWCCK